MLCTLIRGLLAAGRSAARGARKSRRRLRPLLIAAACAAVACGVLVPAAFADPGGLTFAGCIGDLAGCTPTSPAGALDRVSAVAVDGLQVYAVSGAAVTHFTVDATGGLTFAGCIGVVAGCTPVSPVAVFYGANAVAVTADGTQLYTTTRLGLHAGAVSHFTIDATGNPTFAGCIGDLAGCTPTSPAGALDWAHGVAVTADGRQLYATSTRGNTVSHFTINAAGDLTFAGCIGDQAGCTPFSPAGALDGADTVIVTPDGRQLYASSSASGAISHFTIDAAGSLAFAGCIGALGGCTPIGGLGGAVSLAVTPDGAQLYAASYWSNAVSHFTITTAGDLVFAGCVGDMPGCNATTPKTALDGAEGVAVSPVSADLYVASITGGEVTHFKIVGAGDLAFAGCIGDLAGCTPTSPAGALDGAGAVAVSYDGANLYATSYPRNNVSHFRIAGFTSPR